jgi:hypothetical protein
MGGTSPVLSAIFGTSIVMAVPPPVDGRPDVATGPNETTLPVAAKPVPCTVI